MVIQYHVVSPETIYTEAIFNRFNRLHSCIHARVAIMKRGRELEKARGEGRDRREDREGVHAIIMF